MMKFRFSEYYLEYYSEKRKVRETVFDDFDEAVKQFEIDDTLLDACAELCDFDCVKLVSAR